MSSCRGMNTIGNWLIGSKLSVSYPAPNIDSWPRNSLRTLPGYIGWSLSSLVKIYHSLARARALPAFDNRCSFVQGITVPLSVVCLSAQGRLYHRNILNIISCRVSKIVVYLYYLRWLAWMNRLAKKCSRGLTWVSIRVFGSCTFCSNEDDSIYEQ